MKINLIDISKLESFNNHPFKVQDDLDMEELEQSINNGLLEPIIVRYKRNDKIITIIPVIIVVLI